MVNSCYLRQLCHVKSVKGDVNSQVFPGKDWAFFKSLVRYFVKYLHHIGLPVNVSSAMNTPKILSSI